MLEGSHLMTEIQMGLQECLYIWGEGILNCKDKRHF